MKNLGRCIASRAQMFTKGWDSRSQAACNQKKLRPKAHAIWGLIKRQCASKVEHPFLERGGNLTMSGRYRGLAKSVAHAVCNVEPVDAAAAAVVVVSEGGGRPTCSAKTGRWIAAFSGL